MIFNMLILGLIQGLTEFLPVSSSGHLVLFSGIFGVEDSLFVSIVLHLATLLSIVVVLRKDIWQLTRHPLSDKTMKIVIATIPTCLIVLILLPLVNMSFGGAFLPLAFLISAVVLFLTQRKTSLKNNNRQFNIKHAIAMGIAQGLAVFPGISRSGSTICAGLISGGDKEEVAKFSFIMSIPIIILSMLMEIYKIIVQGETVSVDSIALGLSFLVAFIVGILAIKFMLKLTQKVNFKWFSLYLFIISILSLCIQFI